MTVFPRKEILIRERFGNELNSSHMKYTRVYPKVSGLAARSENC
jgi:hypothetical protein